MGEHGKALPLLREGEALARAHDDQARLARVLFQLTDMLRWRTEFADAIAVGQEALALATTRGDLARQVDARFFLGQVYWAIGDYGRATEIFRRNVEALEPGMRRPDHQIQSQAWLAFILSDFGQFAEGPGARERRRSATPRREALGSNLCSPPISWAVCTSPKGTWKPPSACWTRAWPSVVSPTTGT
jgi:tetratricopeptide (TPR) repeat protein